jgi:hypothetical protein
VRIEPRQQLLETWRATVQSSWRDGEWHWGGRGEPNSISDAEQLLCILLPATQIPAFGLDRPNITADAMLAALKPLGNEKTIPLNLVRIATDYFTRYSEDGRSSPEEVTTAHPRRTPHQARTNARATSSTPSPSR